MEKKGKILIASASSAGVLILILAIIFLGGIIPGIQLKPNTYIKNSSIDTVIYSVAFIEGDIVIENELVIANGTINGHSIINSTIIDQSPHINKTKLGSISLYGTANLTLKNIWNNNLTIYLFENSHLNLYNCSIKEITIGDQAYLLVRSSNVSIISDQKAVSTMFTTIPTFTTFIYIDSDSFISQINIIYGGRIEIINSTVTNSLSLGAVYGFTGIFPTQRINMGIIKNSTLFNVMVGTNSYAELFGAMVVGSLSVSDTGRALINQSQIGNLAYGIIAFGNVKINQGIIKGLGYENTTQVFNSVISTRMFTSVVANGTANVEILNFACYVSLYDSANVTIRNTNFGGLGIFAIMAQDTSLLTLRNCSGDGIFSFLNVYCYGDSSVNILDNSTGVSIYILSAMNVFIDNSSISTLQTYPSDFYHLSIDNVTIRNSFINIAYLFGSVPVYFENSTIQSLNEGIVFTSGTFIWTPIGISGTGSYYNLTTFKNTIIVSRILYYVEVRGTTNVTFQDLDTPIFCYLLENARCTFQNCSIKDIQAFNSSVTTIINCKFKPFTTIYLLGDAQMSINQNTSAHNIQMTDRSVISVHGGDFTGIIVFNQALMTLNETIITQVRIFAFNPSDYSAKIYNSTISTLETYGWGLI